MSSDHRRLDLSGVTATRAVTPDEIRDALFSKRRPVVKPLFAPGRPAGVRLELASNDPTIWEKLARFFTT